MRKMLLLLAVSVSAWLCSCNSNDRVEIVRLDRYAALAAHGEISPEAYDSVKPGVEMLMTLTAPESTLSLSEFLANYGTANWSESFGPEVETRLPSLGQAESELGEARRLIAEHLPEALFPSKIYGVITPYRQSVMLRDSVMLIGLNHYLGNDFDGYEGFGYERKLKVPQRMAVEAVEALIFTEFPKTDRQLTLAEAMLYDGAVMYATHCVMPSAKLHDVLGIDAESLKRIESEKDEIWQSLTRNNLLFSTDENVKSRLFAASETADRIYPGCPGRAVRYIGYLLVKNYHKANKSVGLSSLLSPEFYTSQFAFRQAVTASKL